MTREHIKEMLPFMQAFAEGKTIQKHFPFAEDDEWVDDPNPDFNPTSYQWRIKPEPKYRPFEGREECWNEMQKHQPFGWVKTTNDPYRYIALRSVSERYILIGSDEFVLFGDGLKSLTFADGTIFGMKEGGEE